MEKCYRCTVSDQEAGKTVKQLLTGKWHLGTGQIKKAKFRENGILVNGEQVTVRYVLKEGDELQVLIEDKLQASSHLIPTEGEVHILYEDDDFLVVEKPAGIVCHPSGGHYCDSMANLLVGHYAAKGQGFVVRLAGRLDKDTSGLLLYAKNAPALTDFEKQRLNGSLKKTYYAIVCGIPLQEKGTIIQPMGPDSNVEMKQRVCSPEEGGVPAITHYEVINSWNMNESLNGNSSETVSGPDKNVEESAYSLLKIQIDTGRTHQIRCHMAWLGYPLAGDEMYGGNQTYIYRHALHAGRIEVLHPDSREQLTFELPWPEDMENMISYYSHDIASMLY